MEYSKQPDYHQTGMKESNNKVKEFLLLHKLTHYSTLDRKVKSLARLVSGKEFQRTDFDVNYSGENEDSLFTHSALIQAAYFGNINGSSILLKNNANPQQRDAHGWSPLLWAIYFGNAEFVKFILNYQSVMHNKELLNNDETGQEKSLGKTCKYTLEDFLLYGCKENSAEIISILKKSKRYSNELVSLQHKLAQRKVALLHHNSQNLFIKIDLSRIRMDQFITLHRNNRLILKQALIKSTGYDFFLFQNDECCNISNQFTLPIPANIALLASRYEYFIGGVREWKLFLTEYLREFEERMDQMDDLSEKLFWFGNICQLWVYVCSEQEIADKNEFDVDLREFVGIKFNQILEGTLGCLEEEVEQSLLKFYPFGNKNDKTLFDSLHQTPPLREKGFRNSYGEQVKSKMRRFFDKFHLFSLNNESSKTCSEDKRLSILPSPLSIEQIEVGSGPAKIISLLKSVYESASLHFYPLNNVMSSNFAVKLLRLLLSFINYSCLKFILTQQSKYCDKLHGMAIRMNISDIEGWINEKFYDVDPKVAATLNSCFVPLVQVCQYLQIYTCLNNDSAFEEFGKFCEIQQAPNDFLSFLKEFAPLALSNLDLLGKYESVGLTLSDLEECQGKFLVSKEIMDLFVN